MRPRLYLISPAFCRLPAASVIPSRRTPSLLALNSWITNSVPDNRSRLSSNHRQSCGQRMMSIAHGGLRHVRQQCLRVAQ